MFHLVVYHRIFTVCLQFNLFILFFIFFLNIVVVVLLWSTVGTACLWNLYWLWLVLQYFEDVFAEPGDFHCVYVIFHYRR